MTAPTTPRLLVVGRPATGIKALCESLEPEGYAASCFTSAADALALLREQAFDVVLTDLLMPEMSGIEFLRRSREIDPDLVGVVMTAHASVGASIEAVKAGAIDFILKPFRLRSILPVLARAVQIQRLRLENVCLDETVGGYSRSMAIGSAPALASVLEKVADAAMGHSNIRQVSVLLPAENGKALQVAIARGSSADSLQGAVIPISAELAEWIARSLAAKDEPERPKDTPFIAELPGRSWIPMLAAGKFIGILNFTLDSSRRQVVPAQVKSLNILASAAASALAAASLLQQLHSSEERYRRLFEHAADVIFLYELVPHPRFAFVNPVVTAITGYSPDDYYNDENLIFSIVHPDDRSIVESVLRGDYPSGTAVVMRWININGTISWIEQRNRVVRDSDGTLIAIEAIARDITERKLLEDQLRQSQKMEAIGLLAGGVAHDFNNLLTVIIGYSELILADDNPTAEIAAKVDQLMKAAEQAATLTRQLLAFGRKQVTRLRVLDVNSVIENNLKILQRIIGEDVEIVTLFDPAPGHIKADPGQVEQILMNLIVNARGAMPRGGKVMIETKNVTLDETYQTPTLTGRPGPHVMLTVSDTGCGMDASTLSRIFEPFFTTKEVGKGSGLGLSIVYGIVKQSAGHIRVSSEPGQGTRFEISLPCTDERDITGVPLTSAVHTRAGSETILVVEDDAEVRQLICAMLTKAGYVPLIACDGNEALQMCKQREGEISMILTDIVLPGLSGIELIRSIRHHSPHMRILCMSGYAGDAFASHGELDPVVPFMQKPFSSADLVGRVRAILDAHPDVAVEVPPSKKPASRSDDAGAPYIEETVSGRRQLEALGKVLRKKTLRPAKRGRAT